MSAQPKLAPPTLRMQLEVITPKAAAKWLEANRSNRPLSRHVVEGYVEAMRAGDWMINGESIKLDWDGRLVDGQHRLSAIVKAGVSVVSVVIRDLDPEVFKTLDTGKKRSAGDVLAIKGVKNPNAVGGAMRLLHRTLRAQLGHKKRISNSELEALRLEHPRLVSLVEEADHAPYTTPLLTVAALMFAFYMAVSVDEPLARMFFRALAGRPEPTDRSQPNAVKLRERLVSTMDELVPPAPKVRLAWCIEAWNRTVEGKPAERFSRIHTELPEWDPMPSFTRVRR